MDWDDVHSLALGAFLAGKYFLGNIICSLKRM
jgi:energy-converting hydrogenase Eha subunit B